MSAEEADASRLLDDNLERLQRLVAAAEDAGRTRPHLAASLAQAAAQFAWNHHTGWFAYEPLERVTRELGLSSLPPVRARGATARGTLHVATQLYQTGGHTQAIARWTEELADRDHEIVATWQEGTPVPERISRRLGDRVRFRALDAVPGSLLDRAARLRALAAQADLVITHTHPFDVVPSIAFADRRGLPPIVFVDHADHVFWVGIGAYDYVAHLRYSGQELAIRRRGLSPAASLVINRPLVIRGRTRSRADAKAAWGVPADDVLMITAANPGKFRGAAGPDLVSMVESALSSAPRLHWLVAGLDPASEPWSSLAGRTSGRARAVGSLADVGPLHEAADIYLDSFPFAGLTSLLESGAVGNPVITFRGHPEDCSVWGSDSPGIDDIMFAPATPAALEATIRTLVEDPGLRLERGRATAEAVASGHAGESWRRTAESLYLLPTSSQREARDQPPPIREKGALDQLTLRVQSANPLWTDESAAVGGVLGTMGFNDRARVWLSLRREGSIGMRGLMPDWMVTLVRTSRSRALTATRRR